MDIVRFDQQSILSLKDLEVLTEEKLRAYGEYFEPCDDVARTNLGITQQEPDRVDQMNGLLDKELENLKKPNPKNAPQDNEAPSDDDLRLLTEEELIDRGYSEALGGDVSSLGQRMFEQSGTGRETYMAKISIDKEELNIRFSRQYQMRDNTELLIRVLDTQGEEVNEDSCIVQEQICSVNKPDLESGIYFVNIKYSTHPNVQGTFHKFLVQ